MIFRTEHANFLRRRLLINNMYIEAGDIDGVITSLCYDRRLHDCGFFLPFLKKVFLYAYVAVSRTSHLLLKKNIVGIVKNATIRSRDVCYNYDAGGWTVFVRHNNSQLHLIRPYRVFTTFCQFFRLSFGECPRGLVFNFEVKLQSDATLERIMQRIFFIRCIRIEF